MEIAALSHPLDSSEDVIRRAADGDAASFEELVEVYHADVLRVCMVITGDHSLAEDAAQETWSKAWRRLDTLRSAGRFRPWLLAVAANEARQELRRRRRATDSPIRDVPAESHDSLGTEFLDILTGLPFDDRRLLAFRFAVGLSSEEIGTALGISAGAARHRLKRLLENLREELAR